MYVHIGGDVVVRTEDLVAILDARLLRTSEANQRFLQQAAAAGRLRGYGLAAARSVVVTTKGVYPSPISPSTLASRVRAGIRTMGLSEAEKPRHIKLSRVDPDHIR